MRVFKTALPGVMIVEPAVFSDRRGTFSETFSGRRFEELVAPVHFVQDNESRSVRGVVRGLHFQKAPDAQAKLVRAAYGRILDVAVDMRRCGADGLANSNFGRWVSVELSAGNRRQLFIPRGFAHGFSVLSEEAVVAYKCDNYYAPESDSGVLWCDPALGIDWGIGATEAIVSDKDAAYPLFANAYTYE